jgi:hypothetical protein
LLKFAQKTLDKRDFSSSTVAHAMVLVKNHVPDFSVAVGEREALVNSVYDTAQHFVSLYDFSILAESDDNKSLSA